ncbi:MAG: hypothetical protein KJ970_03315 [Candidatus Eisenbacteria bacterium]|uniref:Uncharacterized protein n=1 Tax=Eiseniibacteriota bacterium TaxID=2212470 RepID=A0A948RS20_UNCEI|nr:hypothetical protein [Candidatus Eisenbacteria bacterium]MBU1948456.1 hypothetical protein [Candidatus Eisenbacteria bacterium]MBU2689930.1 hypothetical protein [Candidatus Eisenbacteria bacterium]
MGKSNQFLGSAKPRNVVLIKQKSWIHDLVCEGQTSITPDRKPSRWGHVFTVGKAREDGGIRVYESDIYFARNGLLNGAQESTLKKYGKDKKNVLLHIIDYHLTDVEVDEIIAEAQRQIASGVRYPVLELLGSLWAYITRTFRKRNPLDLKRASYCSAFVNDCFAVVERIVPTSVVHPTNVSPEHIYQSTFRNPESRELKF